MSNRLNRIVMYSDTIKNLYNENPLLEAGEIVIINKDNDKQWIKVGNGSNRLNEISGIKLFHELSSCTINCIATTKSWCFNSGDEYYYLDADISCFTLSDMTGTYINLMSNNIKLPYFAVGIDLIVPGYITNIAIADNELSLSNSTSNEMYNVSMKFIPINNSNGTKIKEIYFYLCAQEKMIDPATGMADLVFKIGVREDGYNTLTELGVMNDTIG